MGRGWLVGQHQSRLVFKDGQIEPRKLREFVAGHPQKATVAVPFQHQDRFRVACGTLPWVRTSLTLE